MKNGFISLGAVFSHALSGASQKKPCVDRPRQATGMKFDLPTFGCVRISTEAAFVGMKEQTQICAWAPVIPHKEQPESLTFRVTCSSLSGVCVLHSHGNNVITDTTHKGIPPFTVSIGWQKNDMAQKYVPDTRTGGKANGSDHIDMVMLRMDGSFAHIQISLVTRHGKFWVVVQEIYLGKVLQGYAIVPLHPVYAYEGNSYLEMAKELGQKVLERSASHCGSLLVSDHPVVTWDYDRSIEIPETLKRLGWQKAVVKFFNYLEGWGFCVCEDGTECFMHFKYVLDKNGATMVVGDEFIALQPTQVVAVKYKNGERGCKATAIRIL